MTRSDYERDICARSRNAVDVRFQPDVFIGDWKPKVAECHSNVDYWVDHYAEYTPVRGWLCYGVSGPDNPCYTAHSVLRDPNGALVDITPVEDPNFVHRWFVEHLGDEATFREMRAGVFMYLNCQGDCPAPPLDPAALSQRYVLEDDQGL